MGKNIFITGSAGFIGSHTVKRAISDGHMVVGIDNLEETYDSKIKRMRIQELSGLKNFEFVLGEIGDKKLVADIIKNNDINCVINLAAKAGVRTSIAQPLKYYQTNLLGTLNILDVLSSKPEIKLIQASTSSVYGSAYNKFIESDTSIRPISPYAASKKSAEELCYVYNCLYGNKMTIFRFFTVYGPMGRPDMSIFRFIKWISENDAVRINGDGMQERDFTYVEDVVRGILAAVNSDWDYEIINLGSDQPHSINTVIELIEKKLGKKANRLHLDPDPADVPFTQASTDKAYQLLDWLATTNLHDGIEKTCVWYKNNRDWVSTLDLQVEKFSKQ